MTCTSSDPYFCERYVIRDTHTGPAIPARLVGVGKMRRKRVDVFASMQGFARARVGRLGAIFPTLR
jgi:hypothetical protein